MKFNWVNALIATIISAMLAWWLWDMGIEDTQSWLLACLGGGLTWIGLLGGMGVKFENPRSGMQAKIMMLTMGTIVFAASCVYSFFTFSPIGYCIPIGVFACLCVSIAWRIYQTKE